jgi:hypothetical protein
VTTLTVEELASQLAEIQNAISNLEAVRANHEAHRASDVDAEPSAQHHTLGSRSNQAAPGDHLHFPVGTAFPYFGPASTLDTDNFFPLEGGQLLKAKAPKLYKAWGSGSMYGETTTHFNVPDLRERAVIGATNDTTFVGENDGNTLGNRSPVVGHIHNFGANAGMDNRGGHSHGGNTNMTAHIQDTNRATGGTAATVRSIQGSATQHNHGIDAVADHAHTLQGFVDTNITPSSDKGGAYHMAIWIVRIE